MRKYQANGEPLLYGVLKKGTADEYEFDISGDLQKFVDQAGRVVVVIEIGQARKLSKEREHKAFKRAVDRCDVCVECQRRLEEHYQRYVEDRADEV